MTSVALLTNPLLNPSPPLEDLIGSRLYSAKPMAARSTPDAVAPFVFPAQDPVSNMTSQTPPNLASRRGVRNSTAPPLPAFNFNPGGACEPDPSPSPTKSTHSDASHHSRGAAAHRRRGSEFVGHDNAASFSFGGSSPPKMDHPVPPPPPPPVSGLGPPAGRRGHSHRRSGAISGSEMSSLIKASAMAKHGPSSAPSTPSDANKQNPFTGDTSKGLPGSQSLPSVDNLTTPPSSPSRRESAPSSVPRPRVVFADDLEFIPRPLSMISSETSSSMSTVRAGHSLNGSVASISVASPQDRPLSLISSPIEDGSPRARPRTADAVSPITITQACPDSASFARRPASISGAQSFGSAFTTTSGSPMKRKHFWSSEPSFGDDVSPKTTPAVEEPNPTEAPLSVFAPSGSPVVIRPKTSPERKNSTKQRKVRTWAGAILTRKGRQRPVKAKGRRTPTPPLLSRPTSDTIFDNDDTVVLANAPSPVRTRASEPTLHSRPISWEPTYPTESRECDGPEIDLDAALDFTDTSSSSPVKSGFAGARARLHSGGGRGSFDNYGNYHRRSESAPELAPFDRSKLSIHRFGSNSSIGDVFDEVEEDDYLAGKSAVSNDGGAGSDSSSPQSLRQSRQVVDQAAVSPEADVQSSEQSSPALDTVEIMEEEDDLSGPGARSSDSTITPPILQDEAKGPASSPMDFAYPTRPVAYASSEDTRPSFPNSAVSSPDADHINFDHARLNPHATEPAYAGSLRPSVDDIPSLTSSASTMTNVVPRFSSSAGTRISSDQRSASFSVPTRFNPNRSTTKRASLASLSKLISGSTGNQSKLRFEESAPSEHGEERTKKKGHRISRLLQFWRTKEKQTD